MSKSDEKEYTLYGSIKGMNEIIDARDDVISSAVSEIGDILEQSRKAVAVQVNQALVATYWKIGEIIVKYEQNDHIRATYGEKTLRTLSKALTREFGKGFSQSNVYNMRQLYICYPKFQTVSGKLSWSHYCELLSISDDDRRMFYEKECINSSWSVRELKRQIDSSLFERLLLSKGDANKEAVLEMASRGIDYSKPEAMIKDPYVFEFLGIPEDKPMLENDLEVKTNQGGLRQIKTEQPDKSRRFKANHNRSRLCNVRGMRYKFEA